MFLRLGYAEWVTGRHRAPQYFWAGVYFAKPAWELDAETCRFG